ncbi:STAS domain-containing protein [Desulfoplanes sp.]
MQCVTTSQSEQGKRIAFQGPCTIENAAAMAPVLHKEITGDTPILFDLSGVDTADLSFFQLLAAGVRRCKSLPITHTFLGFPEELKETAKVSGFVFSSENA